MRPDQMETVRTWLDNWCVAAADSAYDKDQFALSVMTAEGGEVSRVRIIPQVFAIEYRASDGLPSSRTVRIHTLAVSSQGAGLLQGFCYWREATRTFRMDRVISVVDGDGEIHAPPADFVRDLFDSFAVEALPPIRQKDRKVRKPKTPVAAERFINKHAADFVLLKLMAGIDGEVHAMENVAINDHVAKLWLQEDTPISSEHMTHVYNWIDRLAPEQRDYAAAVDAVMKKPPKDMARLLLSMKAVLEADGRHDPRETALLDQLCIDLMA